jgi:hypothetical protein
MTTPTHPRGREPGSPGSGGTSRGGGPSGSRKPTVRQVYALAAALAERLGEEFPATAAEASELIERLRIENGHPSPRLEDTAPRKLPRRGSPRST